MAGDKLALDVRPLTAERWGDLERLFGERGAYGGCWCMWWRITRAEFERNGNAGNRRALRRLVDAGEVPGVLAYAGGEPVAWCSIAPRESYGSLERSPVLKRLDDRPVWSLVCLFIAPGQRGRATAEAVVEGAVAWAAGRGARRIEAYPTLPRGRTLQPVSAFMGVPSLFERCGFHRVARPSEAKAIYRRELRPDRP